MAKNKKTKFKYLYSIDSKKKKIYIPIFYLKNITSKF